MGTGMQGRTGWRGRAFDALQDCVHDDATQQVATSSFVGTARDSFQGACVLRLEFLASAQPAHHTQLTHARVTLGGTPCCFNCGIS